MVYLKLLYYTLRHNCRKLLRLLKYIPVIWETQPWDHSGALSLYIFALEDLLRIMQTADREDTGIKSLTLAIKLLKKSNGEYYKFQDLVDKRWGVLKVKTIPIENSDYYKLEFYRDGAVLPEEIEQCSKDEADAWQKDVRMNRRDFQTALNIIKNYHQFWWD